MDFEIWIYNTRRLILYLNFLRFRLENLDKIGKIGMSHNLNKYRIKISSKETIDPEEIFLDSYKLKQKIYANDSVEGRLEAEMSGKSFVLFLIVIFSVLFFFIARAGELQLLKGEYYKKRALDNRTRSIVAKAPRGIIYDRFYNQLVYNSPSFDILVIPGELPKSQKGIGEFVSKISAIIGEPANEINEIISKIDLSGYQPVILKKNADLARIQVLESRLEEFPALEISYNFIRQYQNGPVFSHILGYLSRVTKEDLEKNSNYYLTDYIGRIGIEQTYEKILKGENGFKEIEVDAKGKPIKIRSATEGEPGENIVLSIDAALQKKLYDEMSLVMSNTGSKKAAALALNPENGEILAMISFPSFDNNLFAKGISEENYKKLIENSQKPLLNRAISGEYPPGSTVKPLIAAAALQEKIIDPKRKILCLGAITISNPYNSLVYTFRDWKAHGLTDIIKAIAESSNVYFYTIGGGYGDIGGLGIERINKYLKLFGFGDSLDIDLAGENKGMIPDKKWKKETKNENWYVGDTYNISIGQGDLSVTPLQLASATAAIANGGTLYKPRLLKKIVTIDKETIEEETQEIIQEKFIDRENIEISRQGMREAVVSGSSRALVNLPVKVAGKTGTAQAGGDKEPHSWFTSFAPYENPEIVLTVLIENGGEGSAAAVPVAKKVLEWYFSR